MLCMPEQKSTLGYRGPSLSKESLASVGVDLKGLNQFPHNLPACPLEKDTKLLYLESEMIDPLLGDTDWTPSYDAEKSINKLFHDSCTDVVLGRMSFRKFSKILFKESFTVTDEWFKIIVSWSDLQPEVDAFASSRNKKLPSFWTAGSSAFLKYWKHNVLWLNPPFSKLNSVVEKILQDEAQGILLVPVWPSRLWFHALSRIAVKWWDLPKEAIFQTEDGKLLPPKPWTVRAVVFNAIGALARMSNGSTWYFHNTKGKVLNVSTLTNIAQNEFLPSVRSLQPSLTSDSSATLKCQNPYSFEDMHIEMCIELPVYTMDRVDVSMTPPYPIRSVISSADTHPQAGPYIEILKKQFKDVVFHPRLARDVPLT